MTEAEESAASVARLGLLAGLTAYTLWGLFPVYFKWVDSVPPLEVLAHRIVWAVPFGAAIIYARKQWPDVRDAFREPKTMFWLTVAAVFIAVNWFVYIRAIQQDQIYQTSLGYYINPLMYVMVGVIFFAERLRPLQIWAVVLATIGVLVLTIGGGQFPWIAIWLGVSFTVYGTIRKQLDVGAMPGLFIETVVLFPIAAWYLVWLMLEGQAVFGSAGPGTSLLLMLAGPVTVVPLLFFAIAAKRLTLTVVGFMQFLAPTMQFFVGLAYGEVLTTAHLVCFGFIWLAVAIFSFDVIRANRKRAVAPVS